ncbi:unnamed protein product (macronuclear) [Paramecium tetraurelia]|uniref:AraC effector-binding domain-containing protein n=1 Tax=Paramecium tetraurelia TaxID=5888 RepID=A0C7A3_PARTE|nr:uncharacterized protein GSPATT00035800001 [Paramecium tetraurelia]CAK66670.1 unnamed protein product [Paramecium tetraurelia]|eukprot:XP_001434067.1 hypothetical protein (macronuclear) [Paramecium tetraurelia strain d4-2]
MNLKLEYGPTLKYPERLVQLDSFTIIGIQRNIIQKDEVDPLKAQIGKTFDEYYSKQLYDQIPNRLHPMRTHCLYFELSDGQDWLEMKYKIVVGELVSEVTNVPEGMVSMQVPAHRFCRFDCGPGPIPDVVIEAWQTLGKLNPQDFGEDRTHDFELEVYPEDQLDRNSMKFQLYIGIQ